MATRRPAEGKKGKMRKPATKPKAPTTPKTPNKTVPLKLPAKARTEYARLMLEVEDAKTDAQRGWDRLWEAAAIVVEKRLFLLEDDTPTAAEWLKKHTGELYRTALRYMNVATRSSPDEQTKYTVSKITLAYEVADARAQAIAHKQGETWVAPETPAKLDLAKQKYAVVREDKKQTLSLEKVTVSELRIELRVLRRKSQTPSHLGPTASAIAKALAKESALDNITVVERGHELSLSHIRADQIPLLVKVLAKLG